MNKTENDVENVHFHQIFTAVFPTLSATAATTAISRPPPTAARFSVPPLPPPLASPASDSDLDVR